jgi:hypothetical protein
MGGGKVIKFTYPPLLTPAHRSLTMAISVSFVREISPATLNAWADATTLPVVKAAEEESPLPAGTDPETNASMVIGVALW